MKLIVGMKSSRRNGNVYLNLLGYALSIVYILWSSKEIARLSNDVDILRKTVRDLQIDDYRSKKNYLDIVEDHYTGEEIHVIDDVKFRHRRALKDAGNNLGKNQCKEKRYLRKCRKKLKRKTKGLNKERVHAAHVALDFKVNTTMFRKLETSKKDCFNEFGGTVCYNSKTFVNGEKRNIVSIPWKMLTTIEWSPLLMTSDNGKYKVKYNGLYLVYINILFIPTQREERVGIFLDNTQILTCQEGLATMQELEARDKLYNLTERSCSSLGVFLVNKDQILSIRVETRNTKIRLWNVGNNFGVVLLYRK